MYLSTITSLVLMAAALGSAPATTQTTKAPSATVAQKSILTVSATGLRNDKGQVLIQLWNAPDGFPTKGEKGFKLVAIDANKAVNGTVSVYFDVTPGTYAVSTLHDENKNNKMDTNALGIPKEGYGASNNIAPHFHPPSFDQVKFQVSAPAEKISVVMRY
jgi:uncharacterized protein (DUF2141 family)